MNEKILKILIVAHRRSGGHCGLTAARLQQELNCNYQDIKEYLIDLYKQNKITVHPNVHGQIIKINPKTIDLNKKK